MASILNAFIVSQTWTSLSTLTGFADGTELILQNVGFPGDIIEVAIQADQPPQAFRGVRLDQIKSFYQISPNLDAVWVRYTRNDEYFPPLRTGLLQVFEPTVISPYFGIPGSALADTGVGAQALRVSTYTAGELAALNGDVYTVSGAISVSGSGKFALNFNLTNTVVIRRIRAVGSTADGIEFSLRNQNSTGTVIETKTPINVNQCSTNTSTVTADVIGSDAAPQGDLLEFGVRGTNEPSGIGCKDGLLSLLFERRDNGSVENVNWAVTFEVLPVNPGLAPPPLQLESDTLLQANTEMSIYG